MTPRQKQENRITGLALLLSMVAYVGIILLLVVFSLFKVEEISNKAGPVLVKLGNPMAPDSMDASQKLDQAQTAPEEPPPPVEEDQPPEEPPPVVEDQPVIPPPPKDQLDPNKPKIPVPSATPLPTPVKTLEPTPTPRPSVKPTPTKTPKPTAKPTSTPKATSKPTAKPTTKPSEKPSPRPSNAPKASTKPDASPRPESTAQPGPVSTQGPVSTAKPAVYKGKDEGNTWELNADKVGVNFTFSPDLTEKMPLPAKIPARFMDKVDAKMKASAKFYTFSTVYKGPDSFGDWNNSGGYSSLSDRTEVWQFLKSLGYDPKQADYLGKVSRSAKFTITVGKDGGKPVKVDLDQSSGSAETDEALRQGLKETAFSNDSGRESVMRFTYTFR